MHRRDFIRTAGATAGSTAAIAAGAGTAAAAEEGGSGGGGGTPDLGGYLDGANNYDGTVVDKTGQDEVTIQVGAGNGLAFGPAAVHVDAGATVVWEWTGEGGAHNVVGENRDFRSGPPVGEAGHTYSRTFEQDGIVKYYCQPHRALGMLGVVVVGTDYPTVAPQTGPTPLNPEHMGIPFQAHFVGLATMLMMVVSLVFTFFLLKYGESPHTKGGND
ncbi:MAG: halocyanin domain-containing protein [Halorientalis sp.]